MKNFILLTFMSFLCIATTYADRGGRSYYDETRYDSRGDFSSSQNTRYLTYEGGNDIKSITLTDLEEVWVSETRQVRSTCTRRIPVTRRVCRDRPRHSYNSEHHRGRGGRHGRPTGQHCRSETTYRTESYTCYKPETIRTRRPDKRFHANFDIKFKSLSTDHYQYGRADFVVSLNKDRVALKPQGQSPRGQNLFFMKEKLNTSRFGDVTEISGVIKVLVFNKDEFLRPVLQRIDVRPDVHHGELVLKTGKIVFEKGLGLRLNLMSEYGRRSLFNGIVPKEYLSVREGRYGDDSIVIVNLERLLHGTLRRGERLDVNATILLNQKDFKLLNQRHVPTLEQTVRSSIVIR